MLRYIFMALSYFLFLSCSGQDKNEILVKIDNREISVSEFTSRMELTPRPFYCRGDSEGDKIIALNALIAEKLFALEEGEKSDLYEDELFNAFVKGRKEQYMREELYRRMAYQPSELDSAEIASMLRLSSYVYKVEFYKLNDEQAKELTIQFRNHPQKKDSLFDAVGLTEKIPQHTVEYKDPEYPSLHHALYSRYWKTGDIIGPVRLRETIHMVVKIKHVFYKPLMSQTEIKQRRDQVLERLVEKKSNIRWNRYTTAIMQGKTIRFYPETTVKIAKIYIQQFIPDRQQTITPPTDQNDFIRFLSGDKQLEAMPMFEMDGQIWKVKDFRRLVLSHPLVFRKPEMPPEEYIHQFKLAVVDLMRDYYVTQEAYKQKIDQSDFVVRHTQMWEDSFLARRHRQRYIAALKAEGKFDPQRMKSRYTHIDAYLDSLQHKYSAKIEVNYRALKNIRLTHTDFVSVQQFVPYQKIVPEFPLLGVDNKLEFGRRMN